MLTTFRPAGAITRLRTFLNADRQVDRSGALISREVEPGFGMDTRLNGFMQFRYIDDDIRSGDRTLGRRQFGYIVRISPSRRVAQLGLAGRTGQEIDFANSRPGTGTTINLDARLNPTNHLAVSFVQNQRWVNVDDAEGERRRLFIARVSRIRGTYTFTSRLFVRGIAQYVSTDRTLSGQALISYKLNWQSVMFIGYGDDRELTERDRLEKLDRQFFVKLSYALQR